MDANDYIGYYNEYDGYVNVGMDVINAWIFWIWSYEGCYIW